ncbi:MAG: ABC transporter substrate-binding protein [Oscillospiraceae bacterium]|jgi:peptide/nickel transport system substrate-binding protein|nr:ABC transporter substrate-binding protein [Oscillospiraceae bacterium]
MKRLIAILIILTLALSACSRTPVVQEYDETPAPSETLAPTPTAEPTPPPEHDKRFTLQWNSDMSFNPVIGLSTNNLQLAGLIYEGLFRINPDYTWEPVLCDSWETIDGIGWIFRIKQGIICHNGAELGLFDIIGSLNTARETGRFVNRLSNIKAVGAKDGAVSITLNKADYDFPALLDIPIMKDGTTYSQRPSGTGPFMLDELYSRLNAFSYHRDYANLPIKTIYLTEVAHEDLIPAFDSGKIDVVVENKSDTGSMEFSAGAERRSYVTNIMHYIGFNSWRGACSDPAKRRVIASMINRAELTEHVLPDCEPSVLPLPPGSPYYIDSIAETALIPEESLPIEMNAVRLADYDGDGHLEYIDDNNDIQKIYLEFIVHRDNLKKVNAAKQIVEMLRAYGFYINFKELSWADYQKALNEGRYDLYYGSIQISANFTLMPLADDKGAARFGYYDATFDQFATEFQASEPGEWKTNTAKSMLREYCDMVPFTPLVFERGTLLTNRGVVAGATPTQYNAFYNFTDWEIDFGG